MTYYFNKTLSADFESVKNRVVEELSKEGFGVLSEIDMQNAFKEKLNVDFRKYLILGACNPHFAHKAVNAEDKIGTMLPCNVILQEVEDGVIEVAAINATASMQAVKNSEVSDIARQISEKLQKVITAL